MTRDITTVRLDTRQVPSNRICFVREIIISCYNTSSGTLNSIKSKFKKKTSTFAL